MGIKSAVRLPRRLPGAAGVALVTALAVSGAYAEANPAHHYGGLHLGSHPPLAAYLLLAVPSVALIWRNSRPVAVLGLAVGGARPDRRRRARSGHRRLVLGRAGPRTAHRNCRRARGRGGYLRDRGAGRA